LNIYGYRNYTVEIKLDNEEFEVFNPNELDLKIHIWNEEYEKKFDEYDIRLDRNEFMSKLLNKITDILKNENIFKYYIFRKKDLNQSYTINPIVFSEECLKKTLIQSCLFDGSEIYVEQKSDTWRESDSKFINVNFKLKKSYLKKKQVLWF
jgi:hypothetical protein